MTPGMQPAQGMGAPPAQANMPPQGQMPGGLPQQQGNSLMGGNQPQGNPLAQQKFTPEQLSAGIEHNKIVSNMMANLLGKADMSSRDVLTMLTDLMKQGMLTPQKAAEVVGTVPSDESQVRPWLMQNFLKTIESGRILHFHQMGV